MKLLRVFAIGSTGSVLAAAVVLGACGSDDTIVTTTDSGFDANPGNTDSGVQDGGADVITDASTDVFLQDVVTDADLTPEKFFGRISQEVCGELARCCFGREDLPDGAAVIPPVGDAGTYNGGRCGQIFRNIGFENSNVGFDKFAQGNVEIDRVKGTDCLLKVDSLVCNLPGATLQAVRSACFGAIKGKVTAGQPCRGSIECAQDLFCDPTQDAGTTDAGQDAGGGPLTGVCVPTRARGQSCDVFHSTNFGADAVKNEEVCSYRGSGTPGLRCRTWAPEDLGADAGYLPREQWTCEPLIENGSSCNSTSQCATGICDPLSTPTSFVCASPVDYFAPTICNAVVSH